MTEQTKHFVELSDVLAFRLECPGCHTFVTVPITTFQQMPRNCPNGCGRAWEQLSNRHLNESLSGLVESIKMVERVTLHNGVLFSLEIARPEKPSDQTSPDSSK